MSKALVLKGTDFSVNKLDTVIVADPIPCTGISLSANTASVEAGKTFTLIATVTPNNTTDSVAWSSSDQTKATVSNGVVTGIGNGTVTITATCGNYSASCTLTVVSFYDDLTIGWFYPTETAIEFKPGYNYTSGAVFNDPCLKFVRSGQTIRLRSDGTHPSGTYAYLYIYAPGNFTQWTEKVGDNYVLTQAALDRQYTSTVSIMNTSTKIAEIKGYVGTWTSEKDYTVEQDCYIAICCNRDGQSDITGDLAAMASAITITVE